MFERLRVLRPVGNPITVNNHSNNELSLPYHPLFYNSGTAALAATIIAARNRKPHIRKPEVIVPAYGCPDLISAAIFAKVTPVLVDLEEESFYLSLEQLNNSINKNTIAIIAVRLFGLSERFSDLYGIAKKNDILLIEDSAQGFPISFESPYWFGDFIVLSFGRGKPINILGGGAVLSRDNALLDLLPVPPKSHCSIDDVIKYKTKLIAYNISINPLFYGIISWLPFLHIGETFFRPLVSIGGMPDYMKSQLAINIKTYQNRRQYLHEYKEQFDFCNKELIIDLPTKQKHNITQPLLRYPILIKDYTARNLIYKKLKCYGASIMYKRPLAKISSVDKFIKITGHTYPNAHLIANMLLTLPTHDCVDSYFLNKLFYSLKEF